MFQRYIQKANGVLFLALAVGGVACSDPGESGRDHGIPPLASDGSLTLGPPELGIQFEMPPFPVKAGQDTEYCYAVTLPQDMAINVSAFQSQYKRGSHHFLLFANRGAPVADFPDGRLYSCGANGEGDINPGEGDMGDFQIVYATQLSAESLRFPEGVVYRFPAGTQMVLNAHYINYTTEDFDGQARVNLVGIEEAAIREEASLYFWFNPIIWIGPNSRFRTYLDCALPEGSNVVTLSTHTHALGTNVDVYSDRGDARRLLHNETDWDEPQTVIYDPPYTVGAGESLHFECTYDNPSDKVVTVGFSSKDEMCVTFGYYYPRADGRSESCYSEILRRALSGEDVPPPLLEMVDQFL